MPERLGSKQGRHLPKVAVGCLLGLLGFAMTVQIGQVEQDAFAVRDTELVELLKSLDAANERIDGEIDELRTARSGLRSSSKLNAEAAEQAKRRADELAILAGSVAATGPGIVLTIEDQDNLVDAAMMLDIVEELRDGGAEAIAINGTVRVVVQTYFSDHSGAIRVAGREIAAPYVIEAIGDPQTLSGAMSIRGGVLDRLANRGASGRVAREDSITITVLADVKTPEYAQAESKR